MSTVTVQGAAVPAVGYGTWLVTGRDAVEGVRDALELGYRHIDTARMYGNEREVGQGIRESGVPREEIWLTTKVWPSEARAKALRGSAEASLRDLETEYVDLLLLHWPAADVPLEETLEALEAVRADGRARHIGVCNFPSALLTQARELAPLFAHQFEFHPYLVQPPVLKASEGILVEAYSPFAHGRLLDDPALTEIGEAHGKTSAQVALRWLLDHPNTVVLPKASSHERRAQNLDVFGFELTAAERERIATLERGLRTANPGFAPAWD